MKARPGFLLLAVLMGCALGSAGEAAIPIKGAPEEIAQALRERKETIEAEPVDAGYLATARTKIDAALAKYSAKVIADCADSIYVAQRLVVDGEEKSSFTDGTALWISGVAAESKDWEVRFHVMMALAILKKHKACFPEEWSMGNPKGFRYARTNEALDASINTRLLSDGFISTYSQSGLSADFALLSAWMFCGGELFGTEIKQYPKLHWKRLMVVRFYRCIDPHFMPPQGF